MKAKLEQIRQDALAALSAATSEAEVEHARVRFLGRKGELTNLVRALRDVPPVERPALGACLNTPCSRATPPSEGGEKIACPSSGRGGVRSAPG